MYNLKYVLVGILFATCSLLADGAENVITKDILSIAHPKANQVMSPGQQIVVQYTIHGTPKSEYVRTYILVNFTKYSF